MADNDDDGDEGTERRQTRTAATRRVAFATSAAADEGGTEAHMTLTTTMITASNGTGLSQFKQFVHAFFVESSCGLTVLSISVLISLSLSSTAGVVPQVVTDRYARIRYGYGSDSDDDPCWTYTTNDDSTADDHRHMPEACIKGADDAQTASAYQSLVMNGVLFLVNSSIGRATDLYGRRKFMIFSIFLYTLSPAALLYVQRVATADPAWYFGARAGVGVMDYFTITFASLSDVIPTNHRAASFAVIMGGFYLSYAFGPSLAVILPHQEATFASWVLSMIALVVAVIFFPETIQQSTPSVQSSSNQGNDADYLAFISIAEETYPPAPPSSAFLDESRQHQISSEENQNQNFPKQSSSSYEESRDVPCENDNETATGVDLLDSNIENGNCDHAGKNLVFWMEDMVLKPFRDMSILSRNHTLRLIALGSFLASTVYNVDHTLVLFYIEQHLDVRDKDMASMLFVLGIVGVIMQCLAFQPLVQCFGERGLLIITFVSGTVHNFIYGAARKKSSIYSALALSQLTKLNFPILSSLSSQQADPHEQGQLQGALFALNALAGAFGPLAMNVVYQHTKDGTMFLASSGLYFTGLVAVLALSRDSKHLLRQEPIGRTDVQNRADSSDEVDREDMEEPLLPLEI